MEFLSNGFTLDVPETVFPLSTDSILLSNFVNLPKNAKVLDLGSGCGTLGTLLCAKDAHCRVTGVELDPVAHASAQKNIAENKLHTRMLSMCADLRMLTDSLSPHCFDVCISNPPYYSGGPASQRTPGARREDSCTLQELFCAAEKMLKFGGDFALVHKPERLAEICICAGKFKLEPKRLCLVRHHENGPVSLILLSCRKGAKPGLLWEEKCLFDNAGHPTEYYRSLYHL